ncbi:phosphatase PAP2 family protein [Rhodococcus sp. HNM0563]|uniref:phosphatase PAP2 family protein n=1 Tax=unclassified Rhodococcus (in: high G+C Gram-positive bacteria) TaxID=192944 RepID=UPI00146C6AF2|nr:phosphatase PAP2 family protein [Rhodococcus sp. F64268]MCK0089450.1 phosphatase PAP2 family protein [Rhodococcus sp. F64268]NLU62979.1 phosphatase PAP2 family protein [Rhodococcus sp. HNM0563]
MNIDEATLDWVVGIRSPELTTALTLVTHAGGGIANLVIATTAVLLLLRTSRPADALLVGGAVATAWPVMTAIKNLVVRARPDEPERLLHLATWSFPSGHAMMSAVLATTLAVVAMRVWPRGDGRRTVAIVGLGTYTVLVGLSRVYLAVHWLTDVLAGWILGFGWALLWVWLLTWVQGNRLRG